MNYINIGIDKLAYLNNMTICHIINISCVYCFSKAF